MNAAFLQYLSLHGLLMALLYIVTSGVLLGGFSKLYIWWTPHDEIALMRAGKVAPVLALGGAMLGFTLPMVTMMNHSASWLDFVLWSLVAMGVQLLLEKFILRPLCPNHLADNNCAVGAFFCFVSVCVGLINAYSFIPR